MYVLLMQATPLTHHHKQSPNTTIVNCSPSSKVQLLHFSLIRLAPALSETGQAEFFFKGLDDA